MNGNKDKNRETTGADAGAEEKPGTREKPIVAEDAVAKDITTSAKELQSQKSKVISFFTAMITTSLVVFIAIGALAWYGWMNYWQPQQQRLQTLERSLNEQLELSKRLNSRQQSTAATREETKKLLASLRNAQTLIEQRLDGHDNRLRNLSGTSRDDWMLAEAKYLLRLASQRLLMERGTVGAQALLESADGVLAAIDNTDLFIVRDALARDLIALKLAPTVDREGIYLQLAALISAIEKLPSVPSTMQRPLPDSPEKQDTIELSQTTPREHTWYSWLLIELKDTLSDLGGFIKIRDHENPPEPLLSQRYQANLIHNLRLMFEQSQSALLREQPVIYRQSLEQAKQWLEQYYVHYPEKDVLVKEIAELQQQPIIQLLPDISGSLEKLTDYIGRYHKLAPEPNIAGDDNTEVESNAERTIEPETNELETNGPEAKPESIERHNEGVNKQ